MREIPTASQVTNGYQLEQIQPTFPEFVFTDVSLPSGKRLCQVLLTQSRFRSDRSKQMQKRLPVPCFFD